MKINWNKIIVAALIIIAIILLLDKCSGGKVLKCNRSTSDTISHRVDTAWLPSRTDTTYVPRLDTVYKPKQITVHDTIEIDNGTEYYPIAVDTPRILSKYFEEKLYSDTQFVTHGKIIINDIVSQNEIKKRNLQTEFNIPEVTNTITLEAKPKVKGYIGLKLIGNRTYPLSGTGITFGITDKKDRYYGIAADAIRTNGILFEIEYKVKIKLKK